MTVDYVEAGDGAGRGGGEEGEVGGGVEVPTLQAGSTLTVRLQLRREVTGGGEADQADHLKSIILLSLGIHTGICEVRPTDYIDICLLRAAENEFWYNPRVTSLHQN